ncbi:MAG: hypothetical protein CVV09_17845 [Gammaproteobacteria bacterium HGW-Gammaproteobacteria-13]|nr:MAG: hypothetical protein CVV09_17845 [Gammaproteobacteria bacterium HGW-Gammaproteobacteria-13]
MFMTYRHAELLPGIIFGDQRVQHWQFVEQEIHYPWFYVELVRDYGDEKMSSMLMIPTVPMLQQVLKELNDCSWLAQAFLVSPGHLRGAKNWLMEPLAEVSIAEDEKSNQPGYVYRVISGASYSAHPESGRGTLRTTEVIFSAGLHLRP